MKLVEPSDPEPREGWVKIRVRAFGLNRSEMYTRQGHSGDAAPFPRVIDAYRDRAPESGPKDLW